jgi:hypothetical protein
VRRNSSVNDARPKGFRLRYDAYVETIITIIYHLQHLPAAISWNELALSSSRESKVAVVLE